MYFKITSLVQSVAQACEMQLILFPALGLLALANRKYTVPKLHKKFYTGVDQVIDRIITDHIRRRIIVMKALRKGFPAIITIHAHRFIKEKFKILRCNYPEQCYLLSLDGKGKIKKTPLSEVGNRFNADPGFYHGFEVWKGTLIVEVEVEDFETNDMYGIEDWLRLMTDLALDREAA